MNSYRYKLQIKPGKAHILAQFSGNSSVKLLHIVVSLYHLVALSVQ